MSNAVLQLFTIDWCSGHWPHTSRIVLLMEGLIRLRQLIALQPDGVLPSRLIPMLLTGISLWISACQHFDLKNYDLDQNISLSEAELKAYTDTSTVLLRLEQLPARRRVDSLIYFANVLRAYEPAFSMLYAQQAFDLATEKNWPIPRGVSAYRLARLKGDGVIFEEDIEDAMVDARISRRLLSPYKNPDWQFNLDELFAVLFKQTGEMDSARFFLEKALSSLNNLEISKEVFDLRKATIYHNLANTYDFADTVGPLPYFYKSDSLYELVGDNDNRVNLWLAWGLYYTTQQEFNMADSLFTLCIDYAQKFRNEKSLSLAYLYRGKSYSDQLNLHGKKTDFIAARNDLTPVSKFKLDDEYLIYDYLANLYHAGWGWDIDESYIDSAIVYYKAAMWKAKDSGAILAMNNLVRNLVALYTYDNGRHKEALSADLGEFLYYSYSGAVNNVTQHSKTAYQRINGVEQRDIEANFAIKRRNQFYTGLTILLLASTIFLLSFQRQQNRRLKAEMAALRAQMDPHFISNSLNAIENLVNRGENQEASKYLIHFSRLSRQILSESRTSVISLEQELKTLKHFLELEKLRFRDKLTYQINLYQEIDAQQVQVPGMILQPYVENAILHGIKPKTEGGTVKVDVQLEGNTLVYIVEDNGIGRQHSQTLKKTSSLPHQSVGMKITEARIRNMGRIKGPPVKIIDLVDDAGQASGTKVIIRLPYTLKPTKT